MQLSHLVKNMTDKNLVGGWMGVFLFLKKTQWNTKNNNKNGTSKFFIKISQKTLILYLTDFGPQSDAQINS